MQYKQVLNIEECLRKYFSTDKELVEKWHIASGIDTEVCVQRTLSDLQKNTYNTFVMYEFADDCGFFGIENKDFLTTFFIHPKNRNKENMKDIWDTIKSTLDNNFKSTIYAKNIPAIKFFMKNNGNVVHAGKHDNDNFLVFEFKGDNLCHSAVL